MQIMEIDLRRLKDVSKATNYMMTDNMALDGAELIPVSLGGRLLPQSHNFTINELGKELLKASTDGNIEEIRSLMGKGAPFTADWLGTSPLHLAAQNNHLEICEILLRAGISRDARTKVDRTPLHMASYEGHVDIVECLLKNGADFDCKDLLHMTPLHWAAQNGHDDVAQLLIRFGATTDNTNKFGLSPSDIALQINRADIAEIISMSVRDPIVATQHLALEMICDSVDDDAVAPILSVGDEESDVDQSENECPEIPIETIMIDEKDMCSLATPIYSKHRNEEILPECIETIEPEVNHSFSESFKLLQQHGITMLPVDDTHILNSVMETGHSVVLTEAGKQALKSIKSSEQPETAAPHQDISEYLKPKPIVTPPSTVKKKKIITVTPEQFMAMTANGTFSGTHTNVLKQINGKIMNNQKPLHVKRIVMRKNKIVPITPLMHVTKIHKYEQFQNVDTLLEELHKAHVIIESYKRKLLKSEVEAARYKQQLKMLLEQKKVHGSS